MLQTKINFNSVRSRVQAAESLQEADQLPQAREVLKSLAMDILRMLKEIP